MKKYTAPKMEILTPEMGIVTYEAYGPHKIVRVISEDFSKIDLRVLEEKYYLDLKDPYERLYSVKELVEDEQRKIAIDIAMTAFEEDLTATTWETFKRKKSEKRRLDAKFKEKSFQKIHRLATDPETGKQDLEMFAEFYRSHKNRRHPGRRKNSPEYQRCPGRLYNAMNREIRSTKNGLHEIITSFNCNSYYSLTNAIDWEDRNCCNSSYWQGYYEGFDDGAADPEWEDTYERHCDDSFLQENELADYRAFAQGYCDGWIIGRDASYEGIQALCENEEIENIFITVK